MSILNDRNAKIMALPTSPQAIPLLTRLAQQPDPTNPMQQTLALMKLNEIKRLASAAQAAQAPQGTVKDQTVQQLAQNMGGVAQVQNARAQQGIQQIAQQAAGQGAAPAGTGQPIQAASGGLMSLPVKRFAQGGSEGRNSDPDYVDRVAILEQELRKATARNNQADIAALQRELANVKKNYVPTKYSPSEQAARSAMSTSKLGIPLGTGKALRDADDPRTRYRGTPAGTGAMLRPYDVQDVPPDVPAASPTPEAPAPLSKLQELYAAKAPEEDRSGINALRESLMAKYGQMQESSKAAGDEAQAKFQQDEQGRSNDSIWKALLAAGEATRGRRGLGGLAAAVGGYGQSVLGAREAERERARKQAELAEVRRQTQEQLAIKVEELKLAHATGDADRVAKVQAEIRADKIKLAELEFKENAAMQRTQATITGNLEAQRLQNEGALASAGVRSAAQQKAYAERYAQIAKAADNWIAKYANTTEGLSKSTAELARMRNERIRDDLIKMGLPEPEGGIPESAPKQTTYDFYATKK